MDNEIGFTTGTGAAAAAKLAVRTWLTKKLADSAQINTPSGMVFTIPAYRCVLKSSFAAAATIKNSGADPDVTRGVVIFAIARPAETTTVTGGAGVGLVTKPGLAVAVGERAINPVPMSMIIKAVRDEIGDYSAVLLSEGSGGTGEAQSASRLNVPAGFEITILIPKGKELAKRTMNARLGILGGISVLGTTGVVRPMSSEAYQESLIAQIAIAKALGLRSVILVFGNIGKRFAVGKLAVKEDAVVEVSNWPVLLARECLKAGIENIILAGHISKVLKVAAGLEDTSHESRFATDIFLEYAVSKLGEDSEIYAGIKDVNTTEEAATILQASEDGKNFIDQIASDAMNFLSEASGYAKKNVAVIITDLAGGVLSEDPGARLIIKDMSSEISIMP